MNFFYNGDFWLAAAFAIVAASLLLFRKKLTIFLDRYIAKVSCAIESASKSHEEQKLLFTEMQERLKGVETNINNMLIGAREKVNYLKQKKEKEYGAMRKLQESMLNHRRELLRREMVKKLKSRAVAEAVKVAEDNFRKNPVDFDKYIEQLQDLRL